MDAVASLSQRYEFDFKLVQGVTPERVKQLSRACDIFIDQLICGEYGLASVEAMSLGKPVICYLKEACSRSLPEGCPEVNANPSTIEQQLELLLADAPLRHTLGKQGRAFVEEHHNSIKVAQQLVQIYQGLLTPMRV